MESPVSRVLKINPKSKEGKQGRSVNKGKGGIHKDIELISLLNHEVRTGSDGIHDMVNSPDPQTTVTIQKKNPPISDIMEPEPEIIIQYSDASFARKSDPILSHLDFSIKRGHFVCIIGQVGSGKSSLLSSIFGDIECTEGSVFMFGTKRTLSFCNQIPFIINASVRENILFGMDYEKNKFSHVVQICALEPDLAMLQSGDMTEIGENGINLSGGQKARISLARAVYRNADLVLLDSVLSAVVCLIFIVVNKQKTNFYYYLYRMHKLAAIFSTIASQNCEVIKKLSFL